MCVKFSESGPDDIHILEATGNNGVHFKRFSNSMLHLGDFYEEITIRHVTFEGSMAPKLDLLNKFLIEVKGKEYSFSMVQLKKGISIALS